MKPIGPLMIEHRLIERMVKLLEIELQNIKNTGDPHTFFIKAGVDFFRMYADSTHHGKEEGILFAKLAAKPLADEDKEMMDSLIQEHISARQDVAALSTANNLYINGNTGALKDVIYGLEKLIKFYPMHIDKEDNHFFKPVMDYFSQQEQQDMLNEFWEFDRKLIHEKYKNIVEEYEKGNRNL